jgi:photosystem II stability/assembly factor-like uncharacterized protein
MKLILWSVALLLCTASMVFAEGWEWLGDAAQGNSLMDVQFVNGSLGFAAGGYGTIIKTTNSGTTWQFVNSNLPVDTDIQKVVFQDEWHGCVIGCAWSSASCQCQSILRSDDGGVTWSERFVLDSTTYNDISFTDRQNGIAVGCQGWNQRGVFVRTTDGGQTWNRADLDFGGSLYQVMLRNRDYGFIRSAAGIWRSTDLGITWSQVACPATPATTRLSFCNELWGYADAENGMYRTTDGGLSWSEIPDPYNGRFLDLQFANPSVGIGWVEYANTIFTTTDGGYNWNIITALYERGIQAMTNVSVNRWWMVGANGIMASTADHGTTWDIRNDDLPRVLRVAAFDSLHVWKTTATSLLRSTDGGRTFDAIPDVPASDFHDLDFSSATNGWAAGAEVMYHTTDGGLTWSVDWTLPFPWAWSGALNVHDSLNISYIFYHSEWHDNDHIMTYGVVRTSDGGANWQISRNIPILEDAVMVNQNIGWGQREWGMEIYRTTTGPDGGWYTCFWPSEYGFNGAIMYPIDSLTCWVRNYHGAGLYRTTDGGLIWSHMDSTYDLGDMVFSRGGRYGMLFGNGSSRFTADSGNTWTEWPLHVPAEWWNPHMSRDGDVWAMHYPNGIAHFTPPRTPTSVFEPIVSPASYELTVYPNPFNASAILQFVLPARSGVTIQIFDILGRCVFAKELGSLDAGAHLERLDASQWTSGIYFARLSAGKSAKTQKVVLLR